MKLPTPSAPFSPVYVHGESITIETEGKVLILPTGNADVLPLFNEYTLNSNRLSIAESPFGGLKGSGSPDYAPGTVNIIEGYGVYLQDVNGQNSSKMLSAGTLKELNLLSVDTVGHSITEEFIVVNTAESNNPTVIDDCETVDNWVVQTGRGTITLETNDKISGSGAIKLTVGGAYSECYIRLNKSINISSAQFICFYLKGPIGKTGQLYIYDSTGKEAVWNLGAYSGNWQRFVLPLSNPNYNTGINYNLVNALRFDIDNFPVQNDVLLIDNITADVARPTYLEIQVPDNLSATSLSLYTHNGTAYQLCSTHSLDGAYSQISQTSANCTFLDGTKLDDVYGTRLGRAVFPKGSAGATVNGSSGSLTYSNNLGTDKRIGLKVDLPPSDNERTNFNKVRLKLVINYTDTVGNIVPDLSGNGNHGTIVGGVTKLNGGGLQFDGVTGEVTRLNVPHDQNITTELVVTPTRNDAQEVLFGQGNFQANGWYVWLTIGKFRLTLNSTTAYENVDTTSNTLYSASETFTLGITIDSAAKTVSFYKNGVLVETKSYSIDWTINTTDVLFVGKYLPGTYRFKGVINTIKLFDSTGLVLHYSPTTQNMGSTTYELSNDNNASTGLQNLSKPWLALYDPTSNLIDFYLFTHRPKNLEFRRDESGNIYELVLYPGNGLIYHGQITYPDLTLDSDSNLIPNFLEESIEGSLTKFLKSYGMVI
jgi:hypothetical protein